MRILRTKIIFSIMMAATLFIPTASYAQEGKKVEKLNEGISIHFDPRLSDAEVQDLLESIDVQEKEYKKTEEGREYLRKAKEAKDDQKLALKKI